MLLSKFVVNILSISVLFSDNLVGSVIVGRHSTCKAVAISRCPTLYLALVTLNRLHYLLYIWNILLWVMGWLTNWMFPTAQVFNTSQLKTHVIPVHNSLVQ